MPKSYSPTFTEQEANNLLQLLDIAVRSTGLQNAAVALAIIEKIKQSEVPVIEPVSAPQSE